MPNLSLLVELADFYDVDIREIIDGERKSERMNHEEKETLLLVADYAENERNILTQRVRAISIIGLVSLLLALLFASLELEKINGILMCIEGICFGLAIGALVTRIFFTTGVLSKIRNNSRSRKIDPHYFHGLPLSSQPCSAQYFPSRYSGSFLCSDCCIIRQQKNLILVIRFVCAGFV